MRSRPGTSIALILTTLAASLAPVGAIAGGTPAATRIYAASLSGTSGPLRRERGRATISVALTPIQSSPQGARRYTVAIELKGENCPLHPSSPTTHPCLALNARLSGQAEMALSPPIPDAPRRIRIVSASGRSSAFGTVGASGEMVGTGFIRRGRRTLRLSLRTHDSSLWIEGQGPLVPGFTPP
jgi:hypothetical protein